MQAEVKSGSSILWQSLLWGRELVKRGAQWRVGDERTILVKKDHWLPRTSSFRLVLTRDPNRPWW